MENSVSSLSEKMKQVLAEAERELSSCQALDALENCRMRMLGRKGLITEALKELGALPADERPRAGAIIHAAKNEVQAALAAARERLQNEEAHRRLQTEALDVTLPGVRRRLGHLHPLTQITQGILDAFVQIGFSVAEGPEIETDYYNFEALNIPKDHPARDMQDTLYLSPASPASSRRASRGGEDLLLRTHTSPIQIHVMEREKPPLRIIAPGRVYRHDEVDASHSPIFHQVEGFVVDRRVSFADLKGVLNYFVRRLFGEKTKVRFRPSFFPFTEPSAEVDISCSVCEGKGCRVCSMRGWLEVLGAGMIHPKVFEAVKYNPKEVTGFAFGMGVERLAMLKYGIHDIRLFCESDARFLKQF